VVKIAEHDAANGEKPKKKMGKIRHSIRYFTDRFRTWLYNEVLPEEGKFTQTEYETGESEGEVPVEKEFGGVFAKNQAMVDYIGKVEQNWAEVEGKLLWPMHDNKVKYETEPHSSTITDMYRLIEFYRDQELVRHETFIFEYQGTIKIEDEETKFNKSDLRLVESNAYTTIKDAQKVIDSFEGKDPSTLTEKNKEDLEDAKERLNAAKAAIGNIENIVSKMSFLPKLKIDYETIPYLNGKPEKIITFGMQSIGEVQARFQELQKHLDNFASSNGVLAATRTPITRLFSALKEELDEVQGAVVKHHEKLHHVDSTLGEVIGMATVKIEKLRPDKNLIRFPHTYKVIKPFIKKKFEEKIKSVEQDSSSDKIFKIVESGKKERIMASYFNPAKNPYKNELEEVKRKIKSDIELRKVYQDIQKFQGIVDNIDNENNAAETSYKNAVSKAVQTRLKGRLIKLIYKELSSKILDDEGQSKSFTKEVYRRVYDLMETLLYMSANSVVLSEDKYLTLNNGDVVTDLRDLINSLIKLDKRTFESHIRANGNDFADWITNAYNLKALSSLVSKMKNKDDIISIIDSKMSISKDNYRQSLKELLEFIESGSDKLTRVLDPSTIKKLSDELKKELRDSKKNLELPPYSLASKRDGLGKLYKFVLKLVLDISNARRSSLTKLKDKVYAISKKIDSIGSVKRDDLDSAFKDLIKDISELLNQETDRIERVSRSIETIKKEIDKIADAQSADLTGIKKKNEGVQKNSEENLKNLKTELRQYFEYVIRKEQLDFYISELTPTHNFRKLDHETEPGKDENGWPLEVDPDTNVVLLDKWWNELGQNEWHLRTIANKTGGSQKLKKELNITATITNGVVKIIGTPQREIRTINKEWIGDIDPMDKIMFIENEWDAFRDDFRDGRYHLYSKTSMDYILAGTKKITPTKSIGLNINTKNENTRIKFRPIYVTGADKGQFPDNFKEGDVIPEIKLTEIPQDERMVTRAYELELYGGRKLEKVRTPRSFNPAFDRAAVGSEFLHWGRMLYYEPYEGVSMWSENPFPHVTSRGIAKYLIDLTMRRTFSFKEARDILKRYQWDFGVRHYGPPFITDPLGPATPGSGGHSGTGQLAGNLDRSKSH